MKKMRLLSVVLAAVMLCSLLAGCGSATVMKIGGSNISENVASAAISYADLIFQQNYGFSLATMLDQEMAEGQTGADLLKEQAEAVLKEFESVRLFAEAEGISLDAEDKEYLKETKKSQMESDGGKKAFLDGLKEQGMNEDFYDYVMTSQLLYSKVYSELFTGEGKYAPTPEAMAEQFSKDYYCIKHVLVMAAETDADFADKKAKAEDIAKRAKAGEDFDALVTEFGEDPGMESSKGGYIMNKEGYTPTGTQMVAEFSEAAAALADGAVSDIVKTDYGFHILKKYALTADHIKTDIEGFTSQIGTALFSEKVLAFAEAVEVERMAAYEKMDLHKILGAEKALGAGVDAEADADSHEGHDHEDAGAVSEELPEITLTPAE